MRYQAALHSEAGKPLEEQGFERKGLKDFSFAKRNQRYPYAVEIIGIRKAALDHDL
ncbi:hypothetical protein [Manganibacter manganicus]|uniref:hypothetical protein n=1 Tax=Manganibacter manganicus TaxID=1873176 RepID=UPI001302073F|nr:hypothetical protein [Pseudaminobacter manganicus]